MVVFSKEQGARKQCLLGIIESGRINSQADKPWHLHLELHDISCAKEDEPSIGSKCSKVFLKIIWKNLRIP